jgi:(1->4)-alpha-D-glucan 1-alpha-D-glucosylmutase
VDYQRRRELLEALQASAAPPPLRELLLQPEDGRCKLLLTWKALQLRRAHPQLFLHGEYRRLSVRGVRAHHLCVFARRHAGHTLVVVAPRLYRRLLDDPARLPLGETIWQDTLIELPREERSRQVFTNVLDGSQVTPERHGGVTGLFVADALNAFPVAMLMAGPA